MVLKSPPPTAPGAADFGIRATLRIGLPLTASVACFAITLFTDRTLLFWYSPTASAASVAAGHIYWLAACLPVTAMGFVAPLVAQAMRPSIEQRQLERQIAQTVWQSIWMTVGICPLLIGLAFYAEHLFLWAGHEASLAAAEAAYLRILLIAAPASMLEAGLSGYFVGCRRTQPVMVANIASATANVGLDFWLIFGGLSVPALGVRGAALATALAMWGKVGLFVALLARDQAFRRGSVSAWRPNIPAARAIVVPGSMLGVQQVIKSLVFSTLLLAIGAASTTGLAASSAALSIYQLLTIPLIGMAQATMVLVGQAGVLPGRRHVATAIQSGLVLAMPYALALATAMTLIPGAVLAVVTRSMDATQLAVLAPTAYSILRILAFYCLAETAGLFFAAALKGLNKTWAILSATCIATLLAAGMSWIGVAEGTAGAIQCWLILLGWSAVQALGTGWSLRRATITPTPVPQPDRLAA